MSATPYHSRLSLLRERMRLENVAAWLQPVHDAFQNEYIPEADRRLPWLCGFTGSAGMLAVTAKNAALFVDGRYTLQAAQELPEGLAEIHNIADKTMETWLSDHLDEGEAAGFDPWLFTSGQQKRLQDALMRRNITAKPLTGNLTDLIWEDRPAANPAPVMDHPLEFAGQSSADKIALVSDAIAAAGADAFLISAPDSLCWLLNIRGSDVPNTPFVLGYALIDRHRAVHVWIDPDRVPSDVKVRLGDQVHFHKPDTLQVHLWEVLPDGSRLLLDPDRAPCWFFNMATELGLKIVPGEDPCQLPKACKNPVEVEGMRQAHIRDGVALVRFFAWLDRQPPGSVDELTAAATLEGFRQLGNHFMGPSFDTIAGFGSNGAIVHYRASAASNKVLQGDSLFLLDSGGQYRDGTTDVTRTIAVGTPTEEQRHHFTLVLKGHIALATARFPEGAFGAQLDAFARMPLWQEGKDYDHGTGHGVGSFLSVHEGPQRISKISRVPLKPGMILSNEPGYYKTGAYGIRIENLVAVQELGGMESGKPLYGFETLTLAPIDRRLVEPALLTQMERDWLNAYHARVRDTLTSLLPDAAEREWLEAATMLL